jgi:nitrilase
VLKKKAAGATDVTATSKVAVVQAAPDVFDREQTIDKLHRLTGEAARAGARTRPLPRSVRVRVPARPRLRRRRRLAHRGGREDFRRYWESSVDVPGPAVERLARAARRTPSTTSSASSNATAARCIARVLFFAPDGTYLGKHRKIMPTASERLVWGFGDGSTFRSTTRRLGRIGAVICWENYLPAHARDDVREGDRDLLRADRRPRESWAASMRHIAVEGRCFVLSCNQFNRRATFPAKLSDHVRRRSRHGDLARRQLHRRSVRQFLAGPNYEGEAILVAEIDRAQIVRGKYDLDVVGHYARPDIFQLHVDERPKRPVTTERAESVPTDEMSAPRRRSGGTHAGSGTGLLKSSVHGRSRGMSSIGLVDGGDVVALQPGSICA